MELLEFKDGSIYSHGNIIENLGFLLTLDKESKTGSLYKYGDSSWLPSAMKKLDPLSEFMVPCIFVFGEYGGTYSKEDQVKIVTYIIEHSASPKTTNVALSMLNGDEVKLMKTFDEMIKASN